MSDAVECKHCGATGTCRNGSEGDACGACIQIHKLRGTSIGTKTGLWCGVCKGRGVAESFSDKLERRVAPFVAISIMIGVLVIAGLIASEEAALRPQVLTLAGTLGGAVTGYYFGGKASK